MPRFPTAVHGAVTLALCLWLSQVSADAPQEEIDKLGNELTPMGSVKAGNDEGTIPAWSGGIQKPPAGYEVGDNHPDPYADDEVKFTITSENYQDYADKLSPGQEAMFERYSDYKMKVYPTRRSAAFPDYVNEATKRNAKTGQLVAGGEGVAQVGVGLPFPFPDTAKEVIWNHKLKYKGRTLHRFNNQVVVSPNSDSHWVAVLREEILTPYYERGTMVDDLDNILFYFFQEIVQPQRLAGQVLLVHETVNQVKEERQAWIYNPGQRRVRRAPTVEYDNPGTASDGLRTSDMLDMFNGAMDRHNWEIVGKQEMYVPYNSYQAHSGDLTTDDLIEAGHLNQDLMRYELHRVWVVEATLKEGERHIHAKRRFYSDVDSWQILLADHYDAEGDELHRFSEAHSINYYEVPTFWSTIEAHYDLQNGRYLAVGVDNQQPQYDFTYETDPSNFTPAALRRRGRR